MDVERNKDSINKLFDRPLDAIYLQEWAKLLAQPPEPLQYVKETALVFFRLSEEWFALPALVFSEIASDRVINQLPYRLNSITLGVVNLRGQIRTCFSLHALLNIKPQEITSKNSSKKYPRLVAIKDDKDIWTFPVDEVEGVYLCDLSMMTNVPVNILNSKENYLKGIIKEHDKKIYVIEEEILFLGLRRKLK